MFLHFNGLGINVKQKQHLNWLEVPKPDISKLIHKQL